MQMQGRAALITGASRGLGLEIARAFAARGAKLVIAARGQEALDAAAAELRALTDVVAKLIAKRHTTSRHRHIHTF